MARTIRPLERDDLRQVASLYEHVARSGSRNASAGDGRVLRGHLPRPPVGRPGDPVTRLRGATAGSPASSAPACAASASTDGPIRVGVSGQLVTDPAARDAPPGAFLMRAYMDGAAGLTLHGHRVRPRPPHLGGPRRGDVPASAASAGCASSGRGSSRVLGTSRCGTARRGEPARCWPVRRRARRGPRSSPAHAARGNGRRGARSSPRAVLGENLEAVTRSMPPAARLRRGVRRLALRADRGVVTARGELVARLVERDGRVLGWYVYYHRRGGISPGAADRRGRARPRRRARRPLPRRRRGRRVAALQGRIEPQPARAALASGAACSTRAATCR